MDDAALAALDRYAQDVLETGTATALALAVTDYERTLAVRSFGDAGDSTLFQIGSVGKSFTAILVLQLAEQGRLDLHAPVTDVLPWFSVQTAHRPITLHDLLTHTAGLISGSEIATGSNFDVVELAGSETAYAPGEHLWYSNVAYRVIGWALETATGQGYPQLVHERILQPLEMGESEPWIVQEMRPRMAPAMLPAFDDRPWRPQHGLVPATWIDSAEADGCVCCSAGDLAVYLRALMTGDPRLLSEQSWRVMRTAHVAADQDDEPGARYGYGLAFRSDGWGHGGGMVGNVTSMWTDGGGLGAVAVLSGIDGTASLVDAALALGRGRSPAPFAPEQAEPVVDDGSCPPDWRAYLGHYRGHCAWLTNFRVVGREGGLWYGSDHISSDRQPLAPLGDGSFRLGEQEWSPERMRFDTVVDGVAQRAWRSGAAYHRTFTP